MWKARAIVASRFGGIQDQIVDGESGVLISDPRDLAQFGSAVAGLLGDPELSRQIGAAAHARVREHFLAPHHLGRYFELIHQLASGRRRTVTAGAAARAGAPFESTVAPT
jgi:trehalose synthase